MAPAEPGADSVQKRRRAGKACSECNRRKVRCDVALVGRPCANCTAGGAACEVLPRKQRRARPRNSTAPSTATENSDDLVNHTVLLAAGLPTTAWSREGVQAGGTFATIDDESGNADALAEAVEDHATAQQGDQTDIYYAGNKHGAVSFVADLVGNEPSEQTLHYLVPHTIRRLKSAEDLEYLRYKGVFSVPPQALCDTLIRAFFLHVHPVVPVLDASTFLTQFTQHGYSNINLLLLWSIIFMAAGFVEPNLLAAAGFASRKGLKRAAYQRAKALYDNAYDDDQITLIQSVILMGHWHADAEDRFEAWHWTGIAISLCQTAGLHCAPTRSGRRLPAMTKARERLCRRIWWTCVSRDRWLSMIKGRPLRIRLEDGDVSPATVEDMHYDLRQVPDTLRNTYLPYSMLRVSQYWCKLVEISLLLGNILAQNARLQLSPAGESAHVDESDLTRCNWPAEDINSMHPSEQICEYHVRLLYHATCIAFWRPKIHVSDAEPPENPSQREAVEKSRAAAVKSNTLLEEMMMHDMLKYMKSQTISALVPPMQIHLLDSKSSATPIRILGTNRLHLCMQVLAEIKETYWAAEFALKLFERAHEKIVLRQRRVGGQKTPSFHGSHSESRSVAPSQTPSLEQMTPESLSSIDDMLMADFSFDVYPGMDMLWSDFRNPGDPGLNAIMNAAEFPGFSGH